MGEEDGAFMEAYSDNMNIQTQEVIEGSDLAIVLQIFADVAAVWEGSATQLLEKLNEVASSNMIDTHNSYWPKTANRLSRSLKILQRPLRDIGLEIEWSRDTTTKKSARIIKIVQLSSEPSDRQKEQSYSESEDTTSDNRKQDKVLSNKDGENHTQGESSDDMTMSDDRNTESGKSISRDVLGAPMERPKMFLKNNEEDGSI
jgi:primosomal protein N'